LKIIRRPLPRWFLSSAMQRQFSGDPILRFTQHRLQTAFAFGRHG
jgi:hypothetical protein